jgi:hypothetical protein
MLRKRERVNHDHGQKAIAMKLFPLLQRVAAVIALAAVALLVLALIPAATGYHPTLVMMLGRRNSVQLAFDRTGPVLFLGHSTRRGDVTFIEGSARLDSRRQWKHFLLLTHVDSQGTVTMGRDCVVMKPDGTTTTRDGRRFTARQLPSGRAMWKSSMHLASLVKGSAVSVNNGP